jgi:hypothetical protein
MYFWTKETPAFLTILSDILFGYFKDPETKKEMEEMQAKMSVQNQMPEVPQFLH